MRSGSVRAFCHLPVPKKPWSGGTHGLSLPPQAENQVYRTPRPSLDDLGAPNFGMPPGHSDHLYRKPRPSWDDLGAQPEPVNKPYYVKPTENGREGAFIPPEPVNKPYVNSPNPLLDSLPPLEEVEDGDEDEMRPPARSGMVRAFSHLPERREADDADFEPPATDSTSESERANPPATDLLFERTAQLAARSRFLEQREMPPEHAQRFKSSTPPRAANEPLRQQQSQSSIPHRAGAQKEPPRAQDGTSGTISQTIAQSPASSPEQSGASGSKQQGRSQPPSSNPPRAENEPPRQQQSQPTSPPRAGRQKEPPPARDASPPVKLSGLPPAFAGPAKPGVKRVSEGEMRAHLANILNNGKTADFDQGGKYFDQRFVETAQGTVDLKHVVAASSLPFPKHTVALATGLWETGQQYSGFPQSAFAGEDMRSNVIGAYAKDRASTPGKTFGEEAARHIADIRVTSLPYGR